MKRNFAGASQTCVECKQLFPYGGREHRSDRKELFLLSSDMTIPSSTVIRQTKPLSLGCESKLLGRSPGVVLPKRDPSPSASGLGIFSPLAAQRHERRDALDEERFQILRGPLRFACGQGP